MIRKLLGTKLCKIFIKKTVHKDKKIIGNNNNRYNKHENIKMKNIKSLKQKLLEYNAFIIKFDKINKINSKINSLTALIITLTKRINK